MIITSIILIVINIMITFSNDDVQVRRSREASGEPGQDSEPGYDLVRPILIIIILIAIVIVFIIVAIIVIIIIIVVSIIIVAVIVIILMVTLSAGRRRPTRSPIATFATK